MFVKDACEVSRIMYRQFVHMRRLVTDKKYKNIDKKVDI